MIKSLSEPSPYQTCFTNGSDICVADSGTGTGGAYGFQPQELLEAALATAMNIAIRMHADRHRIAVASVTVKVALAQGEIGKSTLRARIDIDGSLTDLERRRLLQAAAQCPMARLLRAGIQCGDDIVSPLTAVASAAGTVDSRERLSVRNAFARLAAIDGHEAAGQA